MSESSLPDPEVGLKSSVLSPIEVLGQSIANIAPTATPTVVIPLVFLVSGAGAWAAYLFAVLAIALVAVNINHFARRSASPGNIYSYVALGLGPLAGILTGWALFIAYIGTASAVTTGFTNYVNVLVQEVSGTDSGLATPVLALIVIVSVAGAWFVAHKDVQLSARLMLVLETISVVLITVVVLGTAFTHPLNLQILSLEGVGFDGLKSGLVLAIFSFVGFESATSLGTEAKSPLRSIPRAVLRSALFVGAFFVVSAYAETVGFAGRAVGLDTSAAPIQDLASYLGLGWLSLPITLVAIISFFACTLASLTAGARVLYQIGRHGVLHDSLAGVHADNRTPHVAIAVSALVAVVPAAVLTLLGADLFATYGWVGTTATLAFIFSYAIVAVAAPVYLRRLGELRWHHVALSVATVAFQALAFAGSVYPLPEGAAQWPILAFYLLFAGGLAYGLVVLRRRPHLKGRIRADLAEPVLAQAHA